MKRLMALALLGTALVIPTAGWSADSFFEGLGPVVMGDEGPDRPMMMGGDRMGPGEGPEGRGEGPHGMMRPDPLKMAARLAALETAIGIQSEQLDAWRGYTNALIGLMLPPERDGAKDKKDAKEAKDGKQDDAFARDLMIIKMTTDRAQKAETLGKAIETLRAKLTPAQLEQFKALSHQGPFGGRGRGDHGPDDRDGDRDGRPERD